MVTKHPARFKDPKAARKHLEALNWPDGPVCPHCEALNRASAVKGGRDGLYFCGACRAQYTVTVGTVFERSKIPLHVWLYATHLLCSNKKGIAGHQLSRMLGVTYKTAWFMAYRIRGAMAPLSSAGVKPGATKSRRLSVNFGARRCGKTDQSEREEDRHHEFYASNRGAN